MIVYDGTNLLLTPRQQQDVDVSCFPSVSNIRLTSLWPDILHVLEQAAVKKLLSKTVASAAMEQRAYTVKMGFTSPSL